MKYIMKRNNVERMVDTEESKTNLEALGYAMVKSDDIQKAEVNQPVVDQSEVEPEQLEEGETESTKKSTKQKSRR